MGVNEGAVVLGEETPGDRGLDLDARHETKGRNLVSLAHGDQSPSPPLAAMLIPPRLFHHHLELGPYPVEELQDWLFLSLQPIPLGLTTFLLNLPLDRRLDPPVLDHPGE
jgi:hypothetical protein